jgi:uncharacterized protein YbjQ (UPF0145 family)
MLVVTTETVTGYSVDEVIGHVVGMTARGSNTYNEGVRRLAGGAHPAMSQNLARYREDAVDHMVEQARRRGANAVIGMRFDHRPINSSWIEICAYGTAVRLHPAGQPPAAVEAQAPVEATVVGSVGTADGDLVAVSEPVPAAVG